MLDVLAFDRIGTVRTTDEDGRLKVSRTPISKANVCPYYGREIPGYSGLGLDPDKKYMLLRDPDELSKAAGTFNNLPVLEEHFHVTADDPRRDLQIGATGEGAVFESPYLYNSLTVWDGEAISRIKSGEQRELSSAYRYTPDMTPGEYQGEKYDGVMRDIRGSHVAIVPEGRAGPDVLVADSKPKTEPKMAKKTKLDSLITKLRPFLATDADIEACKKAMDEDMDDKIGCDEDENLEVSREDRLKAAGFSDDEIAKMCASLDVAEDEDSDDDDTAEDEDEEEDREDESEGEEARLARERKDREDESKGAEAAMDRSFRAIERRIRDLHEARDAVKPVVGVVAMDSAEAVYGFALKQAGYKLAGIPKSGYKAMFNQHQAMTKRAAKAAAPRIASDSKAVESIFAQFPELSRIKGA